MWYLVGYILLLLAELIFAVTLCLYALSLLFSSFMGSPYVPTKKTEFIDFLKETGIKKGQIFLELGCGDGRVVRTAVQAYGVKGIGIDINPLLIVWARFLTWLAKIKGIEYKVQNIFQADVSSADVIYLFLMPELIAKLGVKLKKEMKKGTIVLSHGFKIEGWEKYNFKTIAHKPFPTYYYRLPPSK